MMKSEELQPRLLPGFYLFIFSCNDLSSSAIISQIMKSFPLFGRRNEVTGSQSKLSDSSLTKEI